MHINWRERKDLRLSTIAALLYAIYPETTGFPRLINPNAMAGPRTPRTQTRDSHSRQPQLLLTEMQDGKLLIIGPGLIMLLSLDWTIVILSVGLNLV